MSLTGCLSEYSLAEIFNFVQEGHKTGLLSIEPDRCLSRSVDNAYYISFQTGRIMSVGNGYGTEYTGLLKMMEQRQWLSLEQVTGLSINANRLGQPLGTYLKGCNLLDTDQLRLLFDAQVVASICKLFGEIHYGRFNFNAQASLMYAEMTGISLTAQEMSLLGLRMLRDWSSLNAKLPALESCLQKLSSTEPKLRLDRQETNVWNLAQGDLSIETIAERLGLSIEKVQQIAFRLCTIGLLQEVPQPYIYKPIDLPDPIAASNSNVPSPVSNSFLGKLMGFLKQKT
ncbi:DUF4388 domain-containing protein [Chamaesiphon sp. OTE_20_metabat_361]|uniref:DUF4388 domain-containing protein n=1 Tax=Chamaesiphon sp. OTE_20_metabat_361 TaxID=2964689 RepID=UPI00286A9C3A|nr:DUF4388 domain-containing protein [Chamaesiphon sp. OTE_20_metabat_361]